MQFDIISQAIFLDDGKDGVLDGARCREKVAVNSTWASFSALRNTSVRSPWDRTTNCRENVRWSQAWKADSSEDLYSDGCWRPYTASPWHSYSPSVAGALAAPHSGVTRASRSTCCSLSISLTRENLQVHRTQVNDRLCVRARDENKSSFDS